MKCTRRLMKSEKEIKKICQKNVENTLREKHAEISQDIAYQTMAVVMCVLHNRFGFGGMRLQALKDAIEDEFANMKTGILGRNYTTNDCVKFLKDKYNIDFSETRYIAEGWRDGK